MAIQNKNTKTKRDYKPRDLLNKQALNHPFLHQEINLSTDDPSNQNLSPDLSPDLRQANLSRDLSYYPSRKNLLKKNKFYLLLSFLILISFFLAYLHHHEDIKNSASANTQFTHIPLAINLKN